MRLRKLVILIGILIATAVVIGASILLYWYRGEQLDKNSWGAYYEGRANEALVLYQTVTRQYPSHWWFLGDFAKWAPYKVSELKDYIYAYRLEDSGQTKEAIVAYESFLDKHHRGNLYGSLARETLIRLKLEYGQSLYNNGKYAESIEVYQSILAMEMIKSPDLEPMGPSDKWGLAYQQAEKAVEDGHTQAEATIPVIFLKWANVLEKKGDYEGAIDKYHIVLKDYPTILDREKTEEKMTELYNEWAYQLREAKDYEGAIEKYKVILSERTNTPIVIQAKENLAEIYSEWAVHLREEEDHEGAIEKYKIILSEYNDTLTAVDAETAMAETYKELTTWKEGTRAVPVIEFAEEVSRNDEDRWVLITTFNETGGKIGYTLSGEGWIVDVEGNKYGPWGTIINRGIVTVPAGGEDVDEYRFFGDTFIDGYAVFTWSGEDDNGHPITIEEKVYLLP